MSIWVPWLATFVAGAGVFIAGLILKRIDKQHRRQLMKHRHQLEALRLLVRTDDMLTSLKANLPEEESQTAKGAPSLGQTEASGPGTGALRAGASRPVN
jgi:hypothetical protein